MVYILFFATGCAGKYWILKPIQPGGKNGECKRTAAIT
jgi:hypothetical protein